MASGAIEIHYGDNLDVLARLPDASFELVYVDPPFNTGKRQARHRLRTKRAADEPPCEPETTTAPAIDGSALEIESTTNSSRCIGSRRGGTRVS